MNLDLRDDRGCFVCGPENGIGLHLAFEFAEGVATTQFRPLPEHQGYRGISHGGILATVLDEVMVYAAVSLGRWAATAEMTVRYLRPAPTDELLTFTGRVVKDRSRLVECEGECRAPDGRLLATATAKLIKGQDAADKTTSG